MRISTRQFGGTLPNSGALEKKKHLVLRLAERLYSKRGGPLQDLAAVVAAAVS
jgi:hypothetical protein